MILLLLNHLGNTKQAETLITEYMKNVRASDKDYALGYFFYLAINKGDLMKCTTCKLKS